MIAGGGTLGSIGLVISGSGLQVLADTYLGGTLISSGTLQIGDGGASGSLSANAAATITTNGTLVFSRSNTVLQGTDFSSAAITGSGALVQAGPGTLVLNAANTYLGGTVVNGGVVQLGTVGPDGWR